MCPCLPPFPSLPIKFSSCAIRTCIATNPCVATEPWTHQCAHASRPNRAPRTAKPRASRTVRHDRNVRTVRHEPPSCALVRPKTSTRPCACPKCARSRAYIQYVHIAVCTSRTCMRVSYTQSSPSHLEHSVLQTLRWQSQET